MEKATIKTCEEYVLKALANKEVELATTQKELQELKEEHEIVSRKYATLFAKLLIVLNDKTTRVEKNNTITSVYVLGGYVGCYSEYEIEHNEIDGLKLETLGKLIKDFQSIPVREEKGE